MTPMKPEDRLAAFVARTRFTDLPADVLHAAKRSILNIFATAFAGSAEPAIGIYLDTVAPYMGAPTASLVARPGKVDMPTAAFANAAAANIHDFDDTHTPTIIHPTAPVAPALFALAEERGATGADLLLAFVLGGEVECRLGNAVSPWHYARGWHITSTCGVFGAAMGAGKLLALDETHLGYALSNAAAQSAGLVETLGTMSKSLSLGNAARGGVLAALLAQRGFSGPQAVLSGARGFLRVYADVPDCDALTGGLGDHWEIATNTFKPYPVGVVLNPVIDSCLDLRARLGVTQVPEVTMWGHPLLQQRTDRPDVTTGREAQVSAQHTIANVLATGSAGLADYTDVAVTRTLGQRPRITFIDDPDRDVSSARLEFTLPDGAVETVDITDARGSPGNPLTDADLEHKLTAQALAAGHSRTAELIDAIWSLDTLDDAGLVARIAARPDA
ncbi:MAG: MmgE/PrpD family protein [Rhodobacteraceae bacterium]|nr:MmgE/PrpD family protein [Paracoccaceae bacterium]MAY48006.1 MmgE/PrpD family protein [Paracoccaceae bacterium]